VAGDGETRKLKAELKMGRRKRAGVEEERKYLLKQRPRTPRSIGLVLVEENRQRDLTTIIADLFTYSVLEKEGAATVAVVKL
jgi:hypothetical protein